MPDPFEILDGLNQEDREAVRNPERYDFRTETSDKEPVAPEAEGIVAAAVDFANDNIETRCEFHSTREKYTQVYTGEDFSIIESRGTYEIENVKGLTEIYYLVTPENTMLYREGSYSERKNPWPREVADAAPQIYIKAIQNRRETSEEEIPVKKPGETRHVPPPNEAELAAEEKR